MDLVESRVLGLAVAVGLGLLVGLQRQFAEKRIGIRSFALLGATGGIAGLFAAEYGGWILASGLLSVTIVIYGHAYFVSKTSPITGMTTELAAIAMFLIGALATSGFMGLAVVLGGAMTLLLHWKAPMHMWVQRIGAVELEAIVRFVLITLVVLPILPDASYGPYAVLNPRQIWLMVVLIVGLNLVGYIAFKVLRGRVGALLGGVLGGLVSSTATTVSFSTKSRGDDSVAALAGIVILVASALVYVRIVIETAVVARGLLPHLLGPTVAFVLLFLVLTGAQLLRFEAAAHDELDARNPAELRTALSFTLLYAIVLFVSAAANEHFGETMLFPVAVVSGLTDVDAITLSIGRLFAESRIEADAAWRVIFAASLSNLAFKAGIVAWLGGARLRRRVIWALGTLTLIGSLGVWLWP